MGIEIRQETNQASESAGLVSDQKQARVMHLAANARIKTTLMGVITQTSPGVMTGLGGDTSLSLPGGAIPTAIRYYGLVQASTGATITVGYDTTTNNILNAVSVATLALAGVQTPNAPGLSLFQPLPVLPVGQAHPVTGFYSQTATAPGGGPWYVEIDYYLPNPA